MTKDSTKDLMQGRERQVRFRLDTAPAKDVHVACFLAGVLQKGRLPYAWLAKNDQRGAA